MKNETPERGNMSESQDQRDLRILQLEKEFLKSREDMLLVTASLQRANAELQIANQELLMQNDEMDKQAAALHTAHKELLFQHGEKEKRARELDIANKELSFQNAEKGKRAAELIIANEELLFQNGEKEKRATELLFVNKELESFAYVSSHDLQEPLRKIQTFADRLLDKEQEHLSEQGKDYLKRMQASAARMQLLIKDLLSFSRINSSERAFTRTDLRMLTDEVIEEFGDIIEQTSPSIHTEGLGSAYVNPFQFRQLLNNLMSNSFKFSKPGETLIIGISSERLQGKEHLRHNPLLLTGSIHENTNYDHVRFTDNGIGFESQFREKIFEVFQKLHTTDEYPGTGIGLAIVKKIIENHNGIITASSQPDKGVSFDMYFPCSTESDKVNL
jgi:light-regulated signal transduction histidine kinase (bacteriophytochrome)